MGCTHVLAINKRDSHHSYTPQISLNKGGPRANKGGLIALSEMDLEVSGQPELETLAFSVILVATLAVTLILGSHPLVTLVETLIFRMCHSHSAQGYAKGQQ